MEKFIIFLIKKACFVINGFLLMIQLKINVLTYAMKKEQE